LAYSPDGTWLAILSSGPLRLIPVSGATNELAIGDDWRVTPDDKLIRSLHEWLRPENVEFLYA
jgi:hypothetical protein